MRISDWSSDVCSSDLNLFHHANAMAVGGETVHVLVERLPDHHRGARKHKRRFLNGGHRRAPSSCGNSEGTVAICDGLWNRRLLHRPQPPALAICLIMATSPSSDRTEEPTSELQSLQRT